MHQRSELPIVGKSVIPMGSALSLAEWNTIAAASGSRAFTELLSVFNRKLGEISGDRVCINLVNLGDRPGVNRVRPARLRSKRVDREGCR